MTELRPEDEGYETPSWQHALERLLDRHQAELLDYAALRHGELMAAISEMEKRIVSKMDDFKTAFTAYIAATNAWFAAANANQTTSDQLVADAVAKYQANEEVDIQALSDQLAEAAAKVPAMPAAPPPVPPENA